MNVPGSHDPRPQASNNPGALAPSKGVFQIRPRTTPAALDTTPNAAGMLLALKRRWLLALSLALVGGAIAASCLWFSQQTTYTSRTLLRVYSRPPIILAEIDNREDFGNFQRNQFALVKSRFVLNKALANPKVAPLPIVQEKADPVAWLENVIQVDFNIAPEILRIGMTGADPAQSAVLVDGVRDAYLKEIVNKEKNQKLNRFQNLSKLKTINNDRLEEMRQKLDKLAQNLGAKEPKALELLHQFILAQIHAIEGELLKVESDLRREKLEFAVERAKEGTFAASLPAASASLVAITGSVQAGPLLAVSAFFSANTGHAGNAMPDAILDAYMLKEPQLAAAQKNVAAMEDAMRLIRLKRPDLEGDPFIQRNIAILDNERKELARLRENLRPLVAARALEQIKMDARLNREVRQQRIALLDQWKELLTKDLQNRIEELRQFKVDKVNVEWLRDEIATDDAIAKGVNGQLNALKIELDAPDRVTLLEETVTSIDTDGRIRKSGIAGVAAFGLILFGVALVEFRQRRVNSVDDVTRGLEIPLMGVVPNIPHGARRRMNSSNDPRDLYWQNLFSDSVDAVRTMIVHMARADSHKVVMVTSAVGGEGKTVLSCNLAVSLARAGFRTLIVDCDLRRPAVNKVFNLPLEPGAAAVLRGEIEPSAGVQASAIDGLWVMPAGRANSASFQALAQHRFKDIFKHLKSEFDFIVVDSAPVLPVADSALVAQCVDAVLFCVLRDVSRLPTVYAAYERLASLRVNILGAVVNGTSQDHYRAAYHYQPLVLE